MVRNDLVSGTSIVDYRLAAKSPRQMHELGKASASLALQHTLVSRDAELGRAMSDETSLLGDEWCLLVVIYIYTLSMWCASIVTLT